MLSKLRKTMAGMLAATVILSSAYIAPVLFTNASAVTNPFVSLVDNVDSTYIDTDSSAEAADTSTDLTAGIATLDGAEGIAQGIMEGNTPVYVISSAEGLVALARFSNLNDTDNIKFTISSVNSIELDSNFIGIGSSEHPFRGIITSDWNTTIYLNGSAALFRYLSTSASLFETGNALTLAVGEVIPEEPPRTATPARGGLAQVLKVEDSSMTISQNLIMRGSLSNNLPSDANGGFSNAGILFGRIDAVTDLSLTVGCTISNIGTVTSAVSGDAGALIGKIDGNVTLAFTNTTVDGANVFAKSGNAGGIIGKASGNVSITMSDSSVGPASVTAHAGSAGGIAGELSDGKTLTLNGNVSVDTAGGAISAYKYGSTTGNAGGAVGLMNEDSVLSVNSLSVSNLTSGVGVFAGNAAGGIVGNLNLAQISVSSGNTVNAENVTVAGNGCNGGYVGKYVQKQNSITFDDTIIIDLITVCPLVSPSGSGSGGVIGSIVSADKHTEFDYSDSDMPVVRVSFYESKAAGSGNVNFGGIIGEIQNNRDDIFVITGKNTAVNTVSVSTAAGKTNSAIGSAGGVVGRICNNGYLKTTGVTAESTFTTVSTVSATSAGLVGRVNNGSVLVAENSRVNHKKTNNTAVFIGYTGKAAVVELCGSTSFTGANNTESVVRKQDNSLIYAKDSNTTISRSGLIVGDDIGNYGQIINNSTLGSIISLDSTTHEVSIGTAAMNGTTVSVTSLADFARLAITMASHGYISGVAGITSANCTTTLYNATIDIQTDINLDNTGIESLNQSCSSDAGVNLTFNGNNHSISLDIGAFYPDTNTAKYGMVEGVYAHNNSDNGISNLALISVSENCVFNDLTISGKVIAKRYVSGYSDNDIKRPQKDGDTGVRSAGFIGESTGTVDINNCTVSAQIVVCRDDRAESYYGGFIGRSTGNANISITNSTSTANIQINYSGSNIPVIGGLIGDASNLNGKTVDLSGTVSNATITSNASASGNTTLVSENYGIRTAGMIGIMVCAGSTRTNVIIDGNTIGGNIELYVVGNKPYGGLMGYRWINTDVTITDTDINGSVINTTPTSGGDTDCHFGGLIYELAGKITVDGSTTTVTGTYVSTATTGSDGLFVCKGDELYFVLNDQNGTFATMLTDNISDDSLMFSTEGSYFDLLVGNNIVTRGTGGAPVTGGIVTLETSSSLGDTGKMPSADTWYVFKDYGSYGVNSTYVPGNPDSCYNPNTRYYSNIDALSKIGSSSATITSAKDMLLWHLIRYANNSGYLTEFNLTEQDSLTLSANVDLSGYCFYPTSASGISIDLNENKMTFGLPENANAVTAVSDPLFQMYMVQTGIILDTGGFSIKNGNLSGTVNNWTNGSGAVITGTASGISTGKTSVANISVSGVTLDNLVVRNAETLLYAPVLINKISTYVNGDFEDIDQSGYSAGTKAGSSLIGDTGSITAEKISITFDKMVLDGNSATTVFTQSSLLNSINYVAGTSSYIYNFYITEDWNTTTGLHDNKVTYGSELTAESTEYFDSDYYVSPVSNSAQEVYDFSDYIPYVKDTLGYKLSVNIKSDDLIEGWGTYAHPYIIRTSGQMYAVYNLINNGMANINWQVNYPNSLSVPTAFSTYKVDSATLSTSMTKVSGSGSGTTLESVRRWFQTAYYKLEVDSDSAIDMTNLVNNKEYTGIGTVDYPFRGVIVGSKTTVSGVTTATKVIMPKRLATENLTNWGIVGTANGCTVKDICVSYNTTGVYKVSGNNDSCFGGVIGQIIGGDNIIDGVILENLTAGTNLVITNKITFTGGYVGVVKGGGLLFRNIAGNNGVIGYATEYNGYFYANPYVGRVLDGYVIDQTETIDNTDKNYKIPYISANEVEITNTLSGSVYNVTVSNAKELFVLAAAVNSGSISMSTLGYYMVNSSNPSKGYPGFRSGDYSYVGNVGDSGVTTSASGYELLSDDVSSTESVPYLASLFTNTNIKNTNKIQLNISLETGTTYDMTGFGNGFRGIGGEFSTTGKVYLSGFDGKECTVKLKMSKKEYNYKNSKNEYVAETYFSDSMGLFNELAVDSSNYTFTVKDFTLEGEIGLEIYYTDSDNARTNSINNGKVVAVGGVIGSIKMTGTHANSYTFSKVNLHNLTVSSQDVAGGIIGYEFDGGHSTSNGVEQTLFENCSYDGILVTGRSKAGGFVGFGRFRSFKLTNAGNYKLQNSVFYVSRTDSARALNATYRYTDIAAGGVIGFCYGHKDYSVYSAVIDGAKSENNIIYTMISNNGKSQECITGSGGFIGRCDWISVAIDNSSIINEIVVSGSGETYSQNLNEDRYSFPTGLMGKLNNNPGSSTEFTDKIRYLAGRASYSDNYGGNAAKVTYIDGAAGGFIGGFGSNDTKNYTSKHSVLIKNSSVNSTADGVVAICGYNTAGGFMGEVRANSPTSNSTNDSFNTTYGRTYNLYVSDCNFNTSVGSTAILVGGTRSAGICAFAKHLANLVNVTADSVNIGGASSETYVMATASSDTSIAGGLFGDSFSAISASDCTVKNAVIAGSIPGGISGVYGDGSKKSSAEITRCTVDNCFIYSSSKATEGNNKSCSMPGGIISTTKPLIYLYLNECTVSNSRIERANKIDEMYVGGFIGMIQAVSTSSQDVVNANKLLWINNQMGMGSKLFGPEKETKISYSGMLEYSSVTSMNKLNNADATLNTFETLLKTDTLDASNAGLVIGDVFSAANPKLLGISRIDNSLIPKSYGITAKANASANVVTTFADFNSFVTDADASANKIFTHPQFVINPSITLYGDALGKDYVNLTDSAVTTKNNTPLLLNDSTKVKFWSYAYSSSSARYPIVMQNYSGFDSTISSPVKDMPMLVLSGDAEHVVDGYVNLITNGGFNSWINGNAENTVITSSTYSVSAAGTVSKTENAGSVVYDSNTKKFRNGAQYDKIVSGDESTFTVISIKFTNKQSPTENDTVTYTLDIPIYFRQILRMSTYVSPLGFETNKISQFINNAPNTTDINEGGIFTAYIEYAFGEQRMDNTDWNFDKVIYSLNDSGSLDGAVRKFPSGTKMTLFDISGDSSGYNAYYLELNVATTTINFNDFKRIEGEDEIGITYSFLADLPISAPGYSIKQPNTSASPPETADYWGIERYMLIVELPENDTVNATNDDAYRLYADVVDAHNVTVQRDRNYGSVTVWEQTQVSASIAAASTVLSTESAVEVSISPTVGYAAGYQNAISAVTPDLVHYGIIEYQIRDVADSTKVIALPAGTRVTIYDGDSNVLESSVIQNSVSSGKYVLDDNMLVNPAHGEAYTVQLDFSGVDPGLFNTTFPNEYYNMYVDFYLTEIENSPQSGEKANVSGVQLTRQSADAVVVAVNVTSDLLYLGVNNHTDGLRDKTNLNTGRIYYDVNITVDNYEGVHDAALQFNVYKKTNGLYTTPVAEANLGNYISGLMAAENVTGENVNSTVLSYDVSNDISADGQVNQSFTLLVNPSISEYANYMIEAVLTYTDGSGSIKTGKGHFIYTVAKVKTEIE